MLAEILPVRAQWPYRKLLLRVYYICVYELTRVLMAKTQFTLQVSSGRFGFKQSGIPQALTKYGERDIIHC